ncbi:LysR substrate-binding domain-containing protein [Jannaschia sp. KMU-145]|uniref:LysR substrate-binding domain-containing protein n=1 Tax=Jannaschia halovivens TaxID=3388667 RepID=UPI00396B32E1
MAITLRAMRYFTTALRHGSIAGAAAALSVAPSAVAAAIDRIEAHFDLDLVRRQRSKGIGPTASGRIIAQRFERLLEDYEAIEAQGADLKSAPGGTLRIGYYAPVAPAFLPAILMTALPDPSAVELHLEECDNDAAQAGLLDGRYDLILFVSRDVLPSIAYDILIKAPAYALLPEAHPLAAKASVTMAEIAAGPLVVLNRPVASDYYRSVFAAGGSEIAVAAYANSTEMVRSLVGAGLGCAVLNMRPLTARSYGGDAVVARPISDPLPPLSLAIAYDATRPRRLVETVIRACRAQFADAARDRCIVTG